MNTNHSTSDVGRVPISIRWNTREHRKVKMHESHKHRDKFGQRLIENQIERDIVQYGIDRQAMKVKSKLVFTDTDRMAIPATAL